MPFVTFAFLSRVSTSGALLIGNWLSADNFLIFDACSGKANGARRVQFVRFRESNQSSVGTGRLRQDPHPNQLHARTVGFVTFVDCSVKYVTAACGECDFRQQPTVKFVTLYLETCDLR